MRWEGDTKKDLDEAAPSDGPSWGLELGDEIDPTLVVIDSLGGGSRYEVFHAWDRRLFCEVAVKVIRPHRVEEDLALTGFSREASIGARLNHPNLVRLLRWTAAPPRPYLVLEYVRAQTVGDHLADIGPVSVPETCLLGIRICCALHYLHANDVLHLDVKPDNVTTGDPPRLLDLGGARVAAGRVKLDRSIGTAAYMPREQCTHGYATPQSDLFSLGATLYESLSNQLAFSVGDENASRREERYPQLVEEAAPIDEFVDLPPRLASVITACLQHDPARRPRSAAEVATTLEEVLESLRLEELYAWPKGLRVR